MGGGTNGKGPTEYMYLFIYPHSIESTVHDVDPSVFGTEDEEGHECLWEVVEVVLLV